MPDLGETIADQIKKAREQKQPDNSADDSAKNEAWLARIKKILGYGKPTNDAG